ncbi:CNP1-like family protein [uncultured Pseudacidovorax sp.]|uniref:CNP1-like family protein n=1 Tax=uncultured Pseudacidovorax sp. TaxID=679313 RepID=UPI0025D2380D|nr:CNP1-like family protein [uncultured Pseudacidovorax sp.]
MPRSPTHRPPTRSRWARLAEAARRAALGLTGALLLGTAQAQLVDNPDWKESEAPPPPAYDLRRALQIDMPAYMTLKFGVDPKTIVITPDGVVRYVVVAWREGGNAVNAFYEGVRCATAEYKTYARSSGSGWRPVDNPEWKRIGDRNSVYTAELAQQALCRGRAPRASVSDMVRELKRPEILLY